MRVIEKQCKETISFMAEALAMPVASVHAVEMSEYELFKRRTLSSITTYIDNEGIRVSPHYIKYNNLSDTSYMCIVEEVIIHKGRGVRIARRNGEGNEWYCHKETKL